jgi:hypothetical protein
VSKVADEFEDLNGTPCFDENGVDLTLIEYCLKMTPAQRLQTAQSAANAVLKLRRLNGVPGDSWQNLSTSTGPDCSAD